MRCSFRAPQYIRWKGRREITCTDLAQRLCPMARHQRGAFPVSGALILQRYHCQIICIQPPTVDNSFMNWNIVLFGGVILVALLVLKRIGLISRGKARQHLQNGAMLVDVRSPGEFKSRQLPGAVNIPLDQLHSSAKRHLPDKNCVLLLHCLSGTRSGLACRALKQMGYTNVFNLGSYGRAQRIIKQ